MLLTCRVAVTTSFVQPLYLKGYGKPFVKRSSRLVDAINYARSRSDKLGWALLQEQESCLSLTVLRLHYLESIGRHIERS